MFVVLLAVLFLILMSSWTLIQVRGDFQEEQILKPETVASVLGVYTLHFVIQLLAAWARFWPYSSNRLVSIIAGIAISLLGGTLLVLGTIHLGDINFMAGLETGDLVTTGVFRWSRHPQNVGWALILLGIGLVSRSWMALLLALVFWGIFAAYVPLEEGYLEEIYGEEYRRYKERTWRYFGPPGKKPPRKELTLPENESGDGEPTDR